MLLGRVALDFVIHPINEDWENPASLYISVATFSYRIPAIMKSKERLCSSVTFQKRRNLFRSFLPPVDSLSCLVGQIVFLFHPWLCSLFLPLISSFSFLQVTQVHVERDLQDGKGKVGVDDHILILQVTNARLKSWVHDEDCLGRKVRCKRE